MEVQKGEAGALEVNFVLGRGGLICLSHKDDVVGLRVEASVEMQLDCEGLTVAHDEPLQAHLLPVRLLVVPGVLQVDGPELQGCHWDGGWRGDRSLPSCGSLGSASPDTS